MHGETPHYGINYWKALDDEEKFILNKEYTDISVVLTVKLMNLWIIEMLHNFVKSTQSSATTGQTWHH